MRPTERYLCQCIAQVLPGPKTGGLRGPDAAYATRMLNNGMRLEEVSHLLGHATIVQTQKFAKKEVADKARQMLNARKVA